jgi:PIN domain nuclease of toxin-antitoxin system
VSARCLLDTNVLLKWIAGSVPNSIRRYLQRPNTEMLVSVVTPWEIAIKPALRESGLNTRVIKQHLEEMGARLLPVTLEHVDLLGKLPKHHNDPFDRMIISQALLGNYAIVSADQRFPLYQSAGLRVVWD